MRPMRLQNSIKYIFTILLQTYWPIHPQNYNKIFYYTFADVLVNTSAKPYDFFMVPINSTHQDEPICTLECIVLPIDLARNKEKSAFLTICKRSN